MPASHADDYLAAVDERHRELARTLHRLVREAVPDLPVDVGPGGIGYGPFHYRYASGREGDSHLVSLAARKGHVALYVNAVEDGAYLPERYAERLPPGGVGRSCVRFKRDEQVDAGVLRELLRRAAEVGPAGAA
jgi:hypothetical protein